MQGCRCGRDERHFRGNGLGKHTPRCYVEYLSKALGDSPLYMNMLRTSLAR